MLQRTSGWRKENSAGTNGYQGELEDGDRDLPATWQNQRFERLIKSSFYGPRFGAESYTSNGVPTIRTTDINFDGTISLRDPPRVKVSADELERYKLTDGDLLVTGTGATIGKCALYSQSVGPAIPGAYLIRFRLYQKRLLPKFALLFLSSPRGQQLLIGGTAAVAQPNVNAKSISRFTVPIPPIAEQRNIAHRVDELFALAGLVEARYAKAKEHVDNLNQSILAKAFRGELVPQDPNDEPASALLEGIRQARAAKELRPLVRRTKKSPSP
jgi:type I restriction enzyme S subunit